MTYTRHLVHFSAVFGLCTSIAGATASTSHHPSPVLRAQFVLQDSLAYRLPDRRAWSPNGTLLALERNDGLFVYDFGRPGAEPVKVLDGHIARFDWSPDGLWLAGLVFESEHDRRYRRGSLKVVPASGGTPVMVVPPKPGHQVMWAGDGDIYVWSDDPAAADKRAPPPEWRGPKLPKGSGGRGPRSLVSGLKERRGVAGRLGTGVAQRKPGETRRSLADEKAHILVEESSPDGQRYLAQIHG